MRRSIGLVVLALALGLGLVLVLALMGRMLGPAGEAKAPIQPEHVALGRQNSNTERAAQENLPQIDEQYRAQSGADQPTQQGVNAGHVPDGQAQAQRRDQIEAQARDAKAPGAVDISVVGHPFPVSESIVSRCASTRGLYRAECELDKKLLAKMASEPREEPWATSAEGLIRALVEKAPGTYTIRALECRTAICFVETASIFGGFHTPLYDFEKNSGLKAEYPVDSVEFDETGTKIHVSLWAFIRR